MVYVDPPLPEVPACTSQRNVWSDTISTVVHQPHIECEIQIGGETHTGLGYCKRYAWTPAPRYWGYRFIQGFADAGALKLWTAEATFGEAKYDYFYLFLPDGSLVQADEGISCHRENAAFAKVAGQVVRSKSPNWGAGKPN